ncbi:MAG TPA: CoA transferase subunit A [Candidatus Syntrophosphaera thermopropionivorans]|jgi:3-oxoacid CoA-transferase A subunit|nr:CoA transferase subunit A [Candidatus Cloacimonadota bacterium]HOH82485.1 CoA transferase subunit A [Candidatus Syntrophosphaera thermopropionivorans]HRQ98843.1 CoA transferase subunit A [Candidatus Syntrophosphaera sp.]HON32985.1 CoA transferase subunit A [Candidatus Syntrophosphaera thermopropionivorans]HPW24394.1 CoA transferase subunit A [Candidatus Syntrophosphaera thermopropionivorans]
MFQLISAEEAAAMIKPHSRIALGGFLAVGTPETILDAIVEAGINNLHIIAITSDYIGKGIGKLVDAHLVKSVQVSHMGTNKNIQDQVNSGEIQSELIPQGTLMERVRAFGAGLGGVLTPTGLGTIVAEGKQIINVDGKDYLLEPAIPSDFALIRAHKADKAGNLIYRKTARNGNPVMAMAGKITIAEVDEILEDEYIDPEAVITPGVFVNYIVLSKEGRK